MSDKDKTVKQDIELTPKAALAELASRSWAMRPDVLGSLIHMAQEGRLAEAITASDVEAAQRGRPAAVRGGIARVPLKGVLAPVGGLLALLFDIEDPVTRFRQKLMAALGDESVGAVVIDIDSPGGSVDQIPETAAIIREARGQGKPIVAISNSQAASAAYWLGSQADEFVITPSGTAGSIGVYAAHQDMTKMAENDGVKITLVRAGKYKAETHPFVELSGEAQDHMQEDVNTYYEMFTSDVAAGRAKALNRKVTAQDVVDGFGEGRSLTAKAAVAAGLADRVESIGGTVARLASRQRGALPTAAEDVTGAAAEADESEDLSGTRAEADAGAEEQGDQLTAEERELLAEVLA